MQEKIAKSPIAVTNAQNSFRRNLSERCFVGVINLVNFYKFNLNVF